MGLPAVCRLAELAHEPLEGHVEGGRLVVGTRLGADHGPATAAQGQLHDDGVRRILRALRGVELDLDADHSILQSLHGGQTLVDQFLQLGIDRAMPTGDDDVHASSVCRGALDEPDSNTTPGSVPEADAQSRR